MRRVTVVIPTWERSVWLNRALDSVFAQTERDFEIVVVDDGSATDAAECVVRTRGDARARYLRLPQHRGVAAARNAGVRAAATPYVAFLDDDDEWLPDKLERQLSVIERCDASVALAYTARLSVDAITGEVWTTRFPKPFQPAAANVITTSTVLIKRECLLRVGEFDSRFEAGSDYDMWVRLGLNFRFVYIDVPLVKYYIHDNSLSASFRKKRHAAELFLEKHRAVFGQDRQWLARQYSQLAVMCCLDGSLKDAARALWFSIRVSPLGARTYLQALWRCLTAASLLRTNPRTSARPR
jgi:glycosyltransferase involved in cell wall biosynthesis